MNMNTHLPFIQSTPYGPGRALGAGSEYAESSWGPTLPVERYPDNGFSEPFVSAGDGRGRATGQGADIDGFGAGGFGGGQK